jgi:uncharacterized repeat protein (TIGR04138 family)
MPAPQRKKALNEIVSSVGCYPLDAYLFVQDCVGGAAEKVHGRLSEEQIVVARWMSEHEIAPDQLLEMARLGQLPAEVAAALEQGGGPERMNRHVTGQQLCWAIRDIALERWGLMARGVLARWSIRRTEDIGAIIFALVENDWLQKQPTDSIDDFNSVFDFDEAFDHSYQIGVG